MKKWVYLCEIYEGDTASAELGELLEIRVFAAMWMAEEYRTWHECNAAKTGEGQYSYSVSKYRINRFQKH